MSLPAWARLGPNATAPLVGHACDVVTADGFDVAVCECDWTGPRRLSDSAALSDVEHHLATTRWGS
jgi:hypothetical protein